MTGRIKGKGENLTYWLDGQQVSKEEFDAAFPDKPLSGGNFGGHLPACWPLLSDAAGVHPLDIGKFAEDAKSRGVPIDFTADGRAIFRDRGHRKRYMKAYGFRDNGGGYGD